MAGPNEMQQYGGRFKNRYMGSCTAENMFKGNYGAPYCKLHTLRLCCTYPMGATVDRTGGIEHCPGALSLSTVVVSICVGMTPVFLHYAHTFGKFKFHFHY